MNHTINPSIASKMTGLLERTRTRRTFSKDSKSDLTAPATPPTRAEDLWNAEKEKLKSELERTSQDLKHAEKGKLEADRVAQEHALIASQERQAAEEARVGRDEALKDVERCKVSVSDAEKREEEERRRREKIEGDLREVERVCLEKVDLALKGKERAEEARVDAERVAEEARSTLVEAEKKAEEFRISKEKAEEEMTEAQRLAREAIERVSKEVEDARAKLVEAEAKLVEERQAREKAEAELKKQPHGMFECALNTLRLGSSRVHDPKDAVVKGRESTSWSGCTIA